MLVLQRKLGEEIIITVNGREIVVKLLSVGGDGARIGVIADRDVAVDRREVYEAKRKGANDANDTV